MDQVTRKKIELALREIATWSQELQNEMVAVENGCLMQWRGCVAIAKIALIDLEDSNEG